MAGQERIHGGGGADDREDDVTQPAGGQARVEDAAVDDLLDEIDDLLESNAEQFVRGFVQKGGQ